MGRLPCEHYQSYYPSRRVIADFHVMSWFFGSRGGKKPQKSKKTIYIYIYTYICCRVKTWSKICLFLSQNLVQVFSFFSFFVFQKSSSFCRENDILKKTEQKKRKKKHIFWVKTWSNFVAQHTWTRFWLNLGPGFDSTILLIFGYFYLF